MQPQAPPPAPEVPPPCRIHPVASITWATALGTPAAGGVMMALNYWRWGQKPLAVATAVGGFLITAVIGAIAWITPSDVPAALFLVPQVLGGFAVAKFVQGPRINRHAAAGGQMALTSIGAGVGLGFSAVLVAVIVVGVFASGVNPSAILDSQRSVDFGHGQEVFYGHGATKSDARRFGEALKDGGYFDDSTPVVVWIAGSPGNYEVSFAGADGAWDDAANVDYIRQLLAYVAQDIGGEPIRVRLLDEDYNVRKRCRLDRDWRC
jgi:hypothetical protein